MVLEKGFPFIRDLIRCSSLEVSKKQDIINLMRKMYPESWHRVDFDGLFDYIPDDFHDYKTIAVPVWSAIEDVYGRRAITAYYDHKLGMVISDEEDDLS